MKKTPVLFSLILVSSLQFLVFPASAQDATTTPVPTITPTLSQTPPPKKGLWSEVRDKVRETREEIRENFKEAKAEVKEDRREMRGTITQDRQNLKGTPGLRGTISQERLQFRKQRLTTTYTAIKQNLQAHFNLLDTTIKTKVQAKITAQDQAGKNVAEAQTKMSSYSTESYVKNMAALEAKYQEMLSSTDPVNMLGELNKATATVRQDLRTMRQTLLDAFRLALRAPAKS